MSSGYVNLPPNKATPGEYTVGEFVIKEKTDKSGKYWSHDVESGWAGKFPDSPTPQIAKWYQMKLQAAKKSEMEMAAAGTYRPESTDEPPAKRVCVEASPATAQTMRLDLNTIEAMIAKLQAQQDLIAQQLNALYTAAGLPAALAQHQ